jgi:metal-dependent hydrolase (beta-lactamase superfamily II)
VTVGLIFALQPAAPLSTSTTISSAQPLSVPKVLHHHWDHTGRLVTLRSNFSEANPAALGHAHVGEGIFLPRSMDREAVKRFAGIGPPRELLVKMPDIRDEYIALGGQFTVHAEPHQLQPGVYITGSIPRVHEGRNWTRFNRIEREGSFAEDTLPEDQALALDTTEGLVVVGCGHREYDGISARDHRWQAHPCGVRGIPPVGPDGREGRLDR